MMENTQKFRGWKLPIVAVVCLIFSLVILYVNMSTTFLMPIVTPPKAQYADDIAGIGVVEPKSEIISIGSELSGVVRSVHVGVGDHVKADEPLFTLDERDINDRIKTLEATLASTKVQTDDAQAQFDIVKDISDVRAVARDDYNRRKYAALLAQAKMVETQTQLRQAHTTKERLTVKAPIDGEILSVNIRPGEFAAAGQTAEPLIRMGDTSTLHVRVEIDEENASHVSPTAMAKGFDRGDTVQPITLQFVRFEPYVRPKQNLGVSGQRVDTRVLQVIYAIQDAPSPPFIGQQIDVFIDNTGEDRSANNSSSRTSK